MTEKAKESITVAPETQKQRWIKYGSNVVLTAIVVMLLAAALIYIGGRVHRRADLTKGRVYSLKPQSVAILNNLTDPVEIYSLYARPQGQAAQDFYTPMNDLLDEYHSNSRKVQVSAFDPDKEPDQLKKLLERITQRYHGEIDQYKKSLGEFRNARVALTSFAATQLQAQEKIRTRQTDDQQVADAMRIATQLANGVGNSLDDVQSTIDNELAGQLPNYRSAVNQARTAMEQIGELTGAAADQFAKLKDKPLVPTDIRNYITASQPDFAAAKKVCDDALAELNKKGDDKLDSLLRGVRRQSVLVIGLNDVRVIPFGEVWKPAIGATPSTTDPLAYEFAGEQQISTAIASLETKTKTKVAFIRAGGPPLTASPYEEAPFSLFAARLRQYNFDVVEKDLTGSWEMQARMQQQQMPIAPEPKEEEIRDAVWIVLDQPPDNSGFLPSGTIATKVAEHLMNGGSALVLVAPKGDNLSVALKDWGVEIQSDALALHTLIRSSERANDAVEQALKDQPVFVLREYGDSDITRPLQSLDAAVLPVVPIKLTKTAGYQATPILPIPQNPPSFAAHDWEQRMRGQEGAEVTFDASKGDVANTPQDPLYAGAVVQHDKSRLVVIGAIQMATNLLMQLPDIEASTRAHRIVTRFPGNLELMSNSVFWLTHQDTMIAISPSAMSVPRIQEMGAGTLQFWKIGVLIIGLPLLVLLFGASVYVARRD